MNNFLKIVSINSLTHRVRGLAHPSLVCLTQYFDRLNDMLSDAEGFSKELTSPTSHVDPTFLNRTPISLTSYETTTQFSLNNKNSSAIIDHGRKLDKCLLLILSFNFQMAFDRTFNFSLEISFF
jgi:hypothetical protein